MTPIYERNAGRRRKNDAFGLLTNVKQQGPFPFFKKLLLPLET